MPIRSTFRSVSKEMPKKEPMMRNDLTLDEQENYKRKMKQKKKPLPKGIFEK
tara:strand:- start:177 stop:332 length:156 start_codon:yes stop_codon:yes gene_type:complete